MRGEACVGFASILSFAALLLLIFAHVGQINTSSVPRGIAMAKVNISGASESSQTAGLYTNDSSAPLQAKAGLRQFYEFGLYSYCAYVTKAAGICSNTKIATEFRPCDIITADTAEARPESTDTILLSASIESQSRSAYYLILLGSICTALALLTGVVKHSLMFLLSTCFSILGSILLLSGAAIWTAIIKRAQAIEIEVSLPNISEPLDQQVSSGNGIYLIWAACACLWVSIFPYLISCCTYRA